MSASTGYASGLKGTGYDVVKAPRFSPEKMQQMQQLRGVIEPGYQKGLGQLSQIAGGDQSFFDQMEAPALRQFGELQGQLASRFSGMGAGARHSSGFQNASSGAAADLAERLQGNRMTYQNQALQQLMGLYSELTEDPYEMMLQKKKDPSWHKWFGAALPFIGGAVGGGLGFLAGGPAGALTGAKLGGTFGSAGSKAFF